MVTANNLQNDSARTDECVDFLIITALPIERDAVLGQLPHARPVQEDNFLTYYRAKLETDAGSGRRNPVVAVTMIGRAGNVHAAVRTTQCLQRLRPRSVLMVGIAGGVKERVHLGDIVVSEQIIYYEFTKEKPHSSDYRPEVLSADALLLDRAKHYPYNWYTLIHTERPNGLGNTELPKVYFGPITSGEKVVADAMLVNRLRKFHSKLLAIEMESFGVAQAVAQSDVGSKFIAIRGICDYADIEKNDEWHEYAADSAAAFTVRLLRSSRISVPVNTNPADRKTLIAIRHQSMEPLSKSAIEAEISESVEWVNIAEIEINQTDLYENGRLTNPIEAARRQMDIIHQLAEALNTHPVAKIGYFGIAHIPLLFHLGCQVLKRTTLEFFEHNRNTDRWDLLQMGGEDFPITVEGLPDCVNQKRGDVIVRVSISYSVTPESIQDVVANPVASVHLRIKQPEIDAVTSVEQLRRYSAAFRNMLDEIHEKLPKAQCLHIFYAGPVALAVSFGRRISKTIHPRVIVYNYSNSDNPAGYAWGLEVTADVDSQNFLIDRRR